ncbi:MAG TPA: hypothetical protein VEH56_01210 [Candidatus Saccharimonadales bacterium]|nr:hypothetical protein [Candidatus Saccharimonadales bacterium]
MVSRRRKTKTEPEGALGKFYQAVLERRIADAEKELDSMRTTIPSTESSKGYLKACEGLILTAKTGQDKYLYLSKIEKTPKQLKDLRKEFSSQAANSLHADYDRAYFKVLEEYAKFLEHGTPLQPKPTPEAKKS